MFFLLLRYTFSSLMTYTLSSCLQHIHILYDIAFLLIIHLTTKQHTTPHHTTPHQHIPITHHIIILSTSLPTTPSTRPISLGKFVRYMIHEIRNPTSIVTSGLEMIREKLELLKEVQGDSMVSHTTVCHHITCFLITSN